MIWIIALVLVSYLLGSFPTALIAGKIAKGIDIRQHGSGNVGASNVFRVIGKKWGTFVLLTDMLKGFLPAFFFPLIIPPSILDSLGFLNSLKILGLIFGFAAIAGHNWTIFLKFKGGKGVATSAGVFLAILPKAVLCALGVWILTVLITNYIAAGSMIASFSLVLFIFVFYRAIPEFGFLFVMSLILACLVIYTHRSNIDRILKGTEHKVFKPKNPS